MTLFEKIAAREIPSDIVFEDDLCFAFRDITPKSPVHILVVPKRVIARVAEAGPDDAELLGHLLLTAARVAKAEGITGFRLVVNNGADAGETIPHLHIHLLGGRPLGWPPG
jgi:histidine triad (HIT) family protein